MHSFVTSKNAQWPRLIWPTLYMYSFLYTIAEKLRDVPYFSKNILSHLDYSRLHIMSLTLVLHCNCMPHIFCCLHICGLIWPGHATLCRCTGVGSCRRLLHTYTPIFKKAARDGLVMDAAWKILPGKSSSQSHSWIRYWNASLEDEGGHRIYLARSGLPSSVCHWRKSVFIREVSRDIHSALSYRS